MLKSKRFLFTIIGLIVWMFMLYITEYQPVELSTGLLMIIGGYLIAETSRKSDKKDN